MKPLRSILSASFALALLSTGLRAETFPIFEDTAGSTLTNTIPKAAGAAKTLAVSGKSTVFINFGVSFSGIDPATVTAARMIIYSPKASATGIVSIKNLTSAFAETFLAPISPAPTLGATLDTVDLTQIPLNREYFISDITTQVKAWLAVPASEFGVAISSDGVAAVTLASKEGAGSGHPAVLEIDVNRSGGPVAGTNATFTGSVAGASFNGTTFSGSGASLTSLDASNITAGTLADARLSANVPLLNAVTNTFTGNLTGLGFSGSGANLTSLHATNLSSGTVADARLSANIPKLNTSNTFTAGQTINGTLSATTVNATTVSGNGTIPIGGIIMWSGSTPPAGWRICDGTNGTPDLRGRSIQGSGAGRPIGTTGGSESKQLSIAELPSHSFNTFASVRTSGYTASYNSAAEVVSAPSGGTNNGVQTQAGVTDSVGGNQSFSLLTPYYVLAFIQRFQ